jgi:hypothetical protein
MADPDRAVEVRGTVAGRPAAPGNDPDALVADIEETRQELADAIDQLVERVSPASAARKARERATELASRPEVRMAALAAGLAVTGLIVLRIWGRRRR